MDGRMRRNVWSLNMQTTPKITAIAPWFGGKRTMAPIIAEEIGKAKSYYSIGCGSMADFFAKETSPMETAVDLHEYLTTLASVLAREETAVMLYDKLIRTLPCEDMYRTSKDYLKGHPAYSDNAVTISYHYFLASWLERNGVAGTKRDDYQMAVRWTSGGGHGATRFRSAVESIPAWHNRLRSVLILNRDMFDVIPRIADQEGTAIYCDPPYLATTRGGARYQHDFTTENHVQLSDQLRRFKQARVIVSYYDHPRLAELYPDWSVRKCYRNKNLHVQNRRGVGKCEAPEVLLINGESYAKETEHGYH